MNPAGVHSGRQKIAEIHICTVRDTNVAPQKPVKKNKLYFKESVFCVPLRSMQIQNVNPYKTISEQSTCRGEFLLKEKEAFRKKISEVIK